jgi:hypothetical protein
MNQKKKAKKKENTYTDGKSGKQYTQKQINVYVGLASKILFDEQKDEHGFNFCEKCDHNGTEYKLDPAHIKSRKWCKDNSDIELSWDLDNLKVLSRKCHKTYDGLNLQLGTHEKFNYLCLQ